MTDIPASGSIPVFRAGFALKSLRDSGYSLAAALGEVIDNSLEADANKIEVRLEQGVNRRGKRHVTRIAIVDDGTGMVYDTLHRYLQIGFSTRYMSTTTIGKYGVGAKLAACNFAQRIDVWSRTQSDETWRHVSLDLEELFKNDSEGGSDLGIAPPDTTPIPRELSDLIPTGSGTLVLWSKVDRLEEGQRAADFDALRVEVEHELSRMFRYFLEGGIQLTVNGRPLIPYDPLFLMEGTWADKVLSGAGEPRHFPADVIMDQSFPVDDHEARLIVTLYPEEVTRTRGSGGDRLATQLRVPANEGAISFIRLDREINYTSVPKIFPFGVLPNDRFIGIEVSFKPELDDYFGVRNVKRGVEPHDQLRESIRLLLRKAITEAREALQDRWGLASKKAREHEGEHEAITKAVTAADRTLPKSRARGSETAEEQQQLLIDLAKDVGYQSEEEQREYVERIRELPFVIESVDFPGDNFIDVLHLNGKVVIRINTRHRFYREMWEPIRSLADAELGTVSGDEAIRVARRTLETVSLLIVSYGKAESLHENPREAYGDLRGYWGMFLNSLMGKIRDVI